MPGHQSFNEYCDSLSEWVKRQKGLIHAWNIYQTQLQYPAMMAHMYAASQASQKVSEEVRRVAGRASQTAGSAPAADRGDAPSASGSASQTPPPPPPPPPFEGAPAGGAGDRGVPGAVNVPRLNPNVQEENIGIQGRRYKIPHPWRRIAAELIDYALLFFCRILCVSLIAGDIRKVFESIDFDFWYISHSLERHRLDAAAAGQGQGQGGGGGVRDGVFPDGGGIGGLGVGGFSGVDFLTTEILVAEVLNRLVVTIFETVCLSRGLGGRLGGSTPGKLLMGLRVVSCAEVYDFVEHVEVLPGENPGFLSSFVRSIIKNFALVFFFPICLTTLFFQHNRSTYDIISGTLVVSDMPAMNRNQRQPQAAR